MGTSGNRNGYKVFSINTTVRNPQRNIEFLRYFRKFNGFVFDEKIKNLYFVELVKNGVYTFRNLSPIIKEKLLNRAEKYTKEIEPEMKNIKQFKQVIDEYLKGKEQTIKIVMLREFSDSLEIILDKYKVNFLF